MRISWDETGARFFKTGTDRGVLFPYQNGQYLQGVAWNGITGVTTSISGHEKTDLYAADSRKALILFTPFEYAGTIKAFFYPDEFDPCLGNIELVDGLIITSQEQDSFGFCYRTYIGNDTEGTKNGYELHFIYGATVTSMDDSSSTINSSVNLTEMNFGFECVPVTLDDGTKTAHVIVRSTSADPEKLSILEDMVYGSDANDPMMPLPSEIYDILRTQPEPEEEPYPVNSLYPSTGVNPQS